MRFKLLFTLLMVATAFTTFAQQRTCHSHEVLLQQLENDPQRAQMLEDIETYTNNFITNNAGSLEERAVVTIPVVFHVLYRTSAENISDAQVLSQLRILNEDFRRTNSDANGTWSQAADTEIEFCLATVDPNGNATNGITRTSTTKSSFGTNDAMKFTSQGGKDAWDTGSYLNFWVATIGGGILGYAQFPGGAAATDGVVCDSKYVGDTGTATAPFNLGRTGTHEVGHWLNLRHIWGDGNCNADDFVSDTPASDGANYGCASTHVSCNSTDMVQNYMDYSDDACMNLYTAGQKARMQALFGSGGSRASLLASNGCGASSGPTCSDGIQNQGETGVDCGGTCAACPPEPTCSDGIQNGDETGVDCGGSCVACPTGCSQNDVTITITFDNYPEETSWTLVNAAGTTVASGGTYASQADGSTLTIAECVADGCYDFTISDAYGDGICCSYGNGSYTVADANGTVASGGSFTSSETTNFCVGGGGPDPSCSDGIQNQGETGVDCGGPCVACASCDDGVQNQGETGVDCGGPCAACPTCDDGVQNGDETGVDCGGSCAPCGGGECTVVNIDSNNFDSGWGIWNDGGGDVRRSSRDAAYANSGNFCIRLRDNSGAASAMTTDNLNLAGFEEVTVSWSMIANSMENGEDYFLEGSLDGGANYQTIVAFVSGTDFSNGVRSNESVVVTGTYTSTTRFRLRCDASANGDQVYIDDVVLTGCTTGSTRETQPETMEIDAFASLNLYPNPVRDNLNIAFELNKDANVTIFVTDFTGRVINESNINAVAGRQVNNFETTNLVPGFYFVTMITNNERMTKKFVVAK